MRIENLIKQIHVFYDPEDGWGAIVTDGGTYRHISGFGEHPITAIHELVLAVYTAEEILREGKYGNV